MASTPGPIDILKEMLIENAGNIAITCFAFTFIQHTCSGVMKVLAVFGFLIFLRFAASVVNGIWSCFLRRPKNLLEYGDWALVTGATDGIGRALCHEFAARKLKLVVLGRSESKLQDMVKEFQQLYSSNKGFECRYVVVDFSEEDVRGNIEKVKKTIQDIEVGILVNNVGISYPYARFFHEVDEQLMSNLMRINVEVTTRMVHLVLPAMVRRRKGCIINMGSGAASILSSDPLYALYAASKGFVDQFSKSLNVEYKHMGIDVQCQVPLYVATKMTKVRKASIACPSAESYAKCAMRWIGYEARVTPYTLHSLLWWVRGVFREHTIDSHRLRTSLKIRERGQAKEALLNNHTKLR